MSNKEALKAALAILAAIMKMSDEAQALGGATSIAGVASLHKMQTSIQKNGPRLAALAKTLYEEAA
jgi:cell division protein ZapA (FtsZ GTPase activity inhibitor)